MIHAKRALPLFLLLVLLSGCATRQYSASPAVGVETAGCSDLFSDWRQWVDQGNHFDAQAWSPEGFPYLRVNRLLASFPVDKLTQVQREVWLERAQGLATTAWEYEAQSMGGAARHQLPELQRCGEAAVARLLSTDDDDQWQRLAQAARVPASYNQVGRVLGGYPAVAPVVRWRAGVVMGELMDDFEAYQPAHPWRVYQPQAPDAEIDVTELVNQAAARSPLGIPVFQAEEQADLLARYAPTWAVETGGPYDIPGRPGRDTDGELRFQSEPVVFTKVAYTRFDGEVLPQLVYTIWFSRRPSETAFDIVAGELDGLVWRVTLGRDGRPLIYDAIHPCGCYHTWVLAPDGLKPRGPVDYWEEPLWIAGTAPETDRGLVLSLSSLTHQLKGAATALPNEVSRTRSYAMEPYDNLRGPSFAGERLFGVDGMVAGTERPERFLLWPTGVPSAGAMRQWGTHATAFVGTRHFDDPWLLQEYFWLPE
ncbi:hypothetical protein LG325_03030 [Marinobacter nauticus]